MTDEEKLESERIRTYELMGRNILLFQQMEGLLKHLLPSASLDGRDVKELAASRQEKRAKVEKQTLGTLVNDFMEDVVVSKEKNVEEDRSEPGVTLSLHLELPSAEAKEECRQRLVNLVESRNHLVHHFLSDLDHDDLDSWILAQSFLKDLRSRTRDEIEGLREIVREHENFAEALKHPEVRRELKRPG